MISRSLMFESPSLVLNSISEYLKSLISRNILKEFEIGISLFKYFSPVAKKPEFLLGSYITLNNEFFTE